ncbi:MAG: hypothetical protein WCF45_15710, partial [Photobacterium halotolerans]
MIMPENRASTSDLGDLTWHAIIPLYVKNKFDIDGITDLVDFDLGDFDGINNAEKLIEYYETVKSDEEKDQIIYIDERNIELKTKISTLLELGSFDPKDSEIFYGSELWNNVYFNHDF